MYLSAHTLMSTPAFTEEDLGLLDQLANKGFDGVEIHLNEPEKLPVKGLKKKLEETDLQCTFTATLTEEQDLISSDSDVRETGIKFLKRMSDLAAEVGVELIGGVNYAAWGKIPGRMRTDEEWERCVGSFQEVAPYAQSKGVKLALEPVNRFETYFLNTSEDARKLVEDIGEPNVGIHLDTFHMNIEEKNFSDPIREAGDRLYHFHICENDRGVPGTGNVDWKETFSGLQEVGYEGAVVVESFVPEIEEIANQTAIWREIAPSAEAILDGALNVYNKYT